jgi:hypothetical protein
MLSPRQQEEEEEEQEEEKMVFPFRWNGPSKGKARRAFQSQPIGQTLLKAVVDATSLVLEPGISREPGPCWYIRLE